MRAPLTDVLVRSLKPPARGSISVFDANMRGLCLRVSSAGTKSFCVVQGKERTRTYIVYHRVAVNGVSYHKPADRAQIMKYNAKRVAEFDAMSDYQAPQKV